MHENREVNTKVVKLTNMATGSLAKASAMLEDKRYCPEVIQQIDSVI